MKIIKRNYLPSFFFILLILNKNIEVKLQTQKKYSKPIPNPFIPFKMNYKILDNVPKNIMSQTIKRIKYHLINISILLNNLFYTNLPKKEQIISEEVLNNFKIIYNKKNFKTEKKKTHLLLLINFKRLSRRAVVTSQLYNPKPENDDDDPEKKVCYLALLNINTRFRFRNMRYNDEFVNEVLQEIFYIMGFRRPFLRKKNIRNNFNEVPFYLIKDLQSFKSYQKFLKLSDKAYTEIDTVENGSFYVTYWPKEYGFHDIMKKIIKPEASISEITANLFNDMKIYSVNKCDIFKYKAGFGQGFSCLRPNQKCIDESSLGQDYFLEYGIYKGYKIKCYVNTKENIKNKQCGVIYGNLCNLKLQYRFCPVYSRIKKEPKTNSFIIPELKVYKQQTLRLLKRPKQCKAYLPRTIYFSVPESIFANFTNDTDIKQIIKDLEKINKNVEYENITLTENERKYFVTYQAAEENYSRESVMSVLNNSGIIRSYSHLNSHNILLKHPDKSDFQNMVSIPLYQKIYSFINFQILSYKDSTLRTYMKMKKKFPKDYTYLAETYLYPEDKTKIRKMLSDYEPDVEDLWLIKPKSGSLGEGISIFQSLDKAPKEYLLTRYINHPHLINNKKYDFRVYVLISGLVPLRIYLYQEGLARFASEDYILDVKHLSENYRHLTNISLNKKNKGSFVVAKDVDTEEGNRWSLLAYKQYCLENDINYKKIRNQMKDISIKAVLSAYKDFTEKIKASGAQYHNFFHLYGFDFLPDENLNLYFLEGNDRPSLLMGDINDRKLKPQLVADILNLVGISPFSHDYKDKFQTFESKEKFPFYHNRKENIKFNVDNALCELGRPRGRFELIFPLKNNIDKYEHLFEIDMPENNILWDILRKE